jgi:3'-phosphoadenosine 5'-phosphosulfate sulfotransferase (PAPS reductase)/FAD synthetase
MNIICWSGGKDSTATVILAKENKIHIDKIIMSEVMFDKAKGISNEDEEHMKFVREIAIPQFKAWGYDTEILHDDEDYLSLFHKEKVKGGKYGFPLGGMCHLNNYCKIRPITKYLKEHKDLIRYQGIAIDEPNRLKNMKKRKGNNISLLEQFNYTEQMAYDLCKRYNLLSPIYLNGKNRRSGCWNCPNQSYESFARLKQEHPKKWQALKELSKTPNLCSQGFKWGETFEQVEQKVDKIIWWQNNQVSMFDGEAL